LLTLWLCALADALMERDSEQDGGVDRATNAAAWLGNQLLELGKAIRGGEPR